MAESCRLALLLVLLVQGFQRVAWAAFAGPYLMRVRAVSNCPKEEVKDISHCDACLSSVMRHNHTLKAQVMDVNITLSNGIFKRGESTMTLDIARWNTVSGWRDHFLVMAMGELCFVYEEIASDIVKMMADISGVPTKCPIEDGFYGGQNARNVLSPLRHFPSLPYGRYRVYTIFNFKSKQGKAIRSCLRLVVDVIVNNNN